MRQEGGEQGGGEEAERQARHTSSVSWSMRSVKASNGAGPVREEAEWESRCALRFCVPTSLVSMPRGKWPVHPNSGTTTTTTAAMTTS